MLRSAKWGNVDAQGVTDGEAGLFLSPHDMARIGYLYLHNGLWEGKQLIPSSWVERAMSGPVAATFGFHYGNMWWSYPEKGAYMASGRHSQLILVIPKFDVVVVMTGVLQDTEFYSASGLIDDISSSVKSDSPLPDNPIARALLANAVHLAAVEKPWAIGGTSELAKEVSGKVYSFDDNKLHLKTFTLNFYDSGSSWVITTYTVKAIEALAPGILGWFAGLVGLDDVFRRSASFAGLVGLDGVFRRSAPAPYGINAARGRWTCDQTFVMECRILGHSETQTWALTFDGDKVTVTFEDTDGFKAKLQGERTK